MISSTIQSTISQQTSSEFVCLPFSNQLRLLGKPIYPSPIAKLTRTSHLGKNCDVGEG